ncbi:MAG: FtsX-like permease family protein [Lysinibacillus sp.]
MTLSQLVLRSMKKNIKHYYLYFFALIFSVTLYFSFITLQHNPTVLQATEESGTATAGFGAATYLLYFIVLFFVLYANHLFMKRRSKEIGLYQLIGMTKWLIVRLIALENIILFVGAVVIGMVVGFVSSRLFAMILLKVLDQDVVVSMTFSIEALQSTAIVFGILLVIILMQTAFLIHRTSLLSLFNAAKQADERVKRFSWIQMIIGAFGLVLIIYGYYKSSILFTMDNVELLLINMVIILATTIGGTFLVFRFSVAFLMNTIRLGKKGHLNLYDVVAVTPIMHRMKGNAKSLTLITVLTAVSLAITTLSYIAYYSTDTQARITSPTDLVVYDEKGEGFLAALDEKQIPYEMHAFDIKELSFNFADLVAADITDTPFENEESFVPVLKLSEVQQMYPEYHLAQNEAMIMNYVSVFAELLPIEAGITASFWTENQTYEFNIKDVKKEMIAGGALSGGGSPILVVADEVFKELPMQQSIGLNKQYLVELDEAYVETATALYDEMGMSKIMFDSYIDSDGSVVETTFNQRTYEQARTNKILMMGTTIFTTAFLGLAFLLATGSILYFKQMSEADQEKSSYTILRKIGFSERDLLKGIYLKQLFNFGVPLVIGLLHSYFAVKSGWFLFGSELLAPMIITMSLYILMYAVFATLSIQYYKKVIKQAL